MVIWRESVHIKELLAQNEIYQEIYYSQFPKNEAAGAESNVCNINA